MQDWRKNLETWDRLIRQGQGRQVAFALRHLNYSKIPRQYVAAVAATAYRANLPTVSLRIINRLIRPGKNRWQVANPDEMAEYVMALIRIGASREALKTLEPLDAKEYPKVSLYRSFALITQWDYGRATSFLEEFVAHPAITDYQRLIAQVNLAAAWVNSEKFAAAEKLLRRLSKQTLDQNMTLLHGNCLELRAQIAVFNGEWLRAEKLLDKGQELLVASRSVDLLFLKKWQALLHLHQGKKSKKAMAELAQVRERAVGLKHWETVRDCDFYLANFSGDRELLEYVYFGTSFSGYRNYMQRRLRRNFDPPAVYIYKAPNEKKPRLIFDLQTAGDDTGSVVLKEGQLLHRFLNYLCTDFYRPFRFGTIFNELYPDEYFDPDLSVVKINQLAERLRRWIAENNIQAELKGQGSAFHLRLTGSSAFRLHHNQEIKSGPAVYLERLRKHFVHEEFSAGAAAEFLQVSRRMVNKLIAGDEQNSLETIGSGPRTRYRFK